MTKGNTTGWYTKGNPERKINYNFEFMYWEGLTVEQIQLWEKIYPDVNVPQALRLDMMCWLDRMVISRDPLKILRKGRKRNWKAFICNWLKKEQAKAVGIL